MSSQTAVGAEARATDAADPRRAGFNGPSVPARPADRAATRAYHHAFSRCRAPRSTRSQSNAGPGSTFDVVMW